MRLIDADALKECIKKRLLNGMIIGWLFSIVDAIPTIDPESLRPEGEWIEHEWAEESEGLLISNYECTVCHEWVRNKSNFCPNCGADMRGESK